MKTFKKLAAVLFAAIMMLSMTETAFASEAPTTPTYSITAPSNGHTYEAYQIFTGDLADGVLSNVAAGTNAVAGIDVEAALTAITAVANSSDTAKIAVIEQYVDLTGTAYKTIASGATENVPAGYYLIKDVDGSINPSAESQDAYTLYVVQVVGNITISPKSGTPTVVKKVKDTNDTTGATTDWQDSADYDIGDDVPFQLTASIPAAYSTYKDYYLSFNDTLSAGLTLNASSISVKVDGETVDESKYYIYGNQNTFKVVIYDLKDIKASGAQTVTVEYTAVLNEDAIIGAAGNPNVVDLTFSNNPNVEGIGAPEGDTPGTPDKPKDDTPDKPENPGTPDTPEDTDKTPEDKVIVFTYKVIANKVTGDNAALVGASFKLEKKNADGTWKDLGTVDGTNASTFEWKGIDDGDYKITETKTPAGYNSIDPIEFTVSATHDAESDNPALTALNDGEDDIFKGEVSTGAVTSNITNYAGTTLPSTGGMGTTIFYVVGAILVIGAGVMLITKKRMAN